jgi:integrase
LCHKRWEPYAHYEGQFAKVVMALLLGAGLRYGKAVGKLELAQHDTRRTYYAQLGNEAGVDIAKLSCPLGHSSVSVMQRYLNLKLDMEVTASDFVPL